MASITPIGSAISVLGISEKLNDTKAIVDIQLSTDALFNILLVEASIPEAESRRYNENPPR